MSQTEINPDLFNLKTGILGGGQLGKMLSIAAAPWSLNVEIMEGEKTALQKGTASQWFFGDVTDFDQVMKFGEDKDVITIEKENVNADALIELQKKGVKVCPDPKSLKIIQDKFHQKQFYAEHGFKTTSFQNMKKSELVESLNRGEQSLPLVLKYRRFGYDGKGVAVIRSVEELEVHEEQEYLVEEFVQIKKEVSIIAARNHSGQVALFDIVEPIADAKSFLMRQLVSPADVSAQLKGEIEAVARKLIADFKIEGLLAIEFIIGQDDQYYINEVSPRPHNTGHHTIEFNAVSQFEQHWRAILNLPLGEEKTGRHAKCINVLGPEGAPGTPKYHGLGELCAEPEIYIHLYGKEESKPNRKLGHITIVADDAESLKRKTEHVEKHFKVST